MEESVKTLLKRPEEMERKFNVYLQAAKLKQGQSRKRTHTKAGEDKNKWLILLTGLRESASTASK